MGKRSPGKRAERTRRKQVKMTDKIIIDCNCNYKQIKSKEDECESNKETVKMFQTMIIKRGGE